MLAASCASVGALAALGVLLVRCDGSSTASEGGAPAVSEGEARAHGPSDESLAALTAPEPTTNDDDAAPAPASSITTAVAPTSTAPAAARLGAADCAVVVQVLLPPAHLITAEDFVPVEERPGGARLPVTADAVAAVAALVPAEQRTAWDPVVTMFQTIEAAGGAPDEAQQAAYQDARDASEGWGRQACPDAAPSWRCNAFGNRSANPEPTEPDGSAAAAVVREEREGDDAVAVAQSERAQLWAWLDADGFVVRTVQVERVGDGWAVTRRHTCLGSG